jgi:hypothetical protein
MYYDIMYCRALLDNFLELSIDKTLLPKHSCFTNKLKLSLPFFRSISCLRYHNFAIAHSYSMPSPANSGWQTAQLLSNMLQHRLLIQKIRLQRHKIGNARININVSKMIFPSFLCILVEICGVNPSSFSQHLEHSFRLPAPSLGVFCYWYWWLCPIAPFNSRTASSNFHVVQAYSYVSFPSSPRDTPFLDHYILQTQILAA